MMMDRLKPLNPYLKRYWKSLAWGGVAVIIYNVVKVLLPVVIGHAIDDMRHGITLGHVLAPGELRVRAAVPEQDVQLVRERLRHARVRLSDAPGEAWPAALAGAVPASTRELPSAALADHGGGPYISDPAEKDGLHSLEPVFLFDLTLSGRTLDRVGGRAWVRFDYGSEALAPRAYRRAAQLFLRHFSTSD